MCLSRGAFHVRQQGVLEEVLTPPEIVLTPPEIVLTPTEIVHPIHSLVSKLEETRRLDEELNTPHLV